MSESVHRRRRADRYQEEPAEEYLQPAAPALDEELTPAPAEPAPRIRPAAEFRAEPAPAEPMAAPEQPIAEEAASIPQPRDVLATNTGVRLACTMAAMMGLFALFLCWAEQESRVIRRFSVQSAALTALHAALGGMALLLSTLLGAIPFFGLMVTLLCLLGYIAGLILLLITRVRLMQRAWQGVRFALPAALERLVRRYY